MSVQDTLFQFSMLLVPLEKGKSVKVVAIVSETPLPLQHENHCGYPLGMIYVYLVAFF